MATRKSSKKSVKGKSSAARAQAIFERLSKSGVVNAGATVGDVMKQVAASEGEGEADLTAVFDTNKYLLIMA